MAASSLVRPPSASPIVRTLSKPPVSAHNSRNARVRSTRPDSSYRVEKRGDTRGARGIGGSRALRGPGRRVELRRPAVPPKGRPADRWVGPLPGRRDRGSVGRGARAHNGLVGVARRATDWRVRVKATLRIAAPKASEVRLPVAPGAGSTTPSRRLHAPESANRLARGGFCSSGSGTSLERHSEMQCFSAAMLRFLGRHGLRSTSDH